MTAAVIVLLGTTAGRAGLPVPVGQNNTGQGYGKGFDIWILGGNGNSSCGCTTDRPGNDTVITGSHPTNGFSGELFYSLEILRLPARGIPFRVTAFHQTRQRQGIPFTQTWFFNLVLPLRWHSPIPGQAHRRLALTYPDGQFCTFVTDDDVHYRPDGAAYASTTDTVVRNTDGTFDLTTKYGLVCHFTHLAIPMDFGETLVLSSIRDRNGNTLTWNWTPDSRIESITDASGQRVLQVDMDPVTNGAGGGQLDVKIHSLTDWTGRTWTFGGWQRGYLAGWYPGRMTAPGNRTWHFNWTQVYWNSNTAPGDYPLLSSVIEPDGDTDLAVTYASNFDGLPRLVSQSAADGTVEDFSWQYWIPPNSPPGTNGVLCLVRRSKNGVFQGTRLFQYAPTGDLLASTDEMGSTTRWVRDSRGRPLSETDALGRTSSQTWDDVGNLTSRTDAQGNTWRWTYTADFNLLSRIESPIGQVWTMAHDARGNLTSVTDPLGHTTLRSVDAYGQTTAVTDARGRTWTFGYNAAGDMTSSTDPLSNPTWLERDALGRITAVIDALGHTRRTTYDDVDRPTSTTDALGNASHFTWDREGNLRQVIDALGRAANMNYNELHLLTNLTDPTGNVTRCGYDGRNNLSRVNNARGVDSLKYANNLVDLPIQEDVVGDRTEVTYDAVYQPVSERDPKGQVTTNQFDPLGRLLLRTYADGSTVRYTYDRLGRRTSMIDGIGTTTYTWDNANRQVAVEQYGCTIRYQYDETNRPVRTVDACGIATVLTYDGAGRLLRAQHGSDGAVEYVYDRAGRLTGRAFSNGVSATYLYDDADRVIQIWWARGWTPLLVHAFDYDAMGNRTNDAVLRFTSDDGLNRLRVAAAAMLGLSSSSGGEDGVLWAESWTYGYDNLGQLVSAVCTPSKKPDSDDGRECDEDAQGDTPEAPRGLRHDYTFDPVGNRLTLNESTFAYNDKDQLVNAQWSPNRSESFEYDTNGNLASRTSKHGTTRYTWDCSDRLTGVQLANGRTVRMRYSGDGALVEQTDAGGHTVRLVWSGSEIINEFDARGGTRVSYCLAGSREGGIVDGQRRWALTGPVGSVEALVDARGRVTDSYWYDEYGKPRSTRGKTFNPYRYVGGYGCRLDSETALTYMRQRWYDASLQRFVSRDPLRHFGAFSTSNPYAYCSNNPMSTVDPSGLIEFEINIFGYNVQISVDAGQLGTGLGQTLIGTLGFVGGSGLQGGGLVSVPVTGGASSIAVYGGTLLQASGATLSTVGVGNIVGAISLSVSDSGPFGSNPVPTDPSEPPAPGFQWKGKPPIGGNNGSWHNPSTSDTLHPDLGHPPPIGPHWDWKDACGKWWRIFIDGTIAPK